MKPSRVAADDDDAPRTTGVQPTKAALSAAAAAVAAAGVAAMSKALPRERSEGRDAARDATGAKAGRAGAVGARRWLGCRRVCRVCGAVARAFTVIVPLYFAGW